jgi:hypothetical protein
MMTFGMARLLVGQSFEDLLHRDATPAEYRGAIGQAMSETSLGSGWSPKIPGALGSNNMGAYTAGSEWKGATFEHRDSRPVKEPPPPHQQWYVTKFRSYPTALDGMRDLVKWYVDRPEVLRALSTGDVRAFCAALYARHYYTGFKFTAEENIADYARRVSSCIATFNAGFSKTPKELVPLFIPGEWQPRIWDIYQFGWQEMLDEAQGDMTAERDAIIRDAET